MDIKICSKCGLELPAREEYFALSKQNEGRFVTWCRKCRYEIMRPHHKKSHKFDK